MSKGFVFDSYYCVNCSACSAACILYNDWSGKPRSICTYNEKALPDLPVVNISLACNHCMKAACMEGCPSKALSRDKGTGAVILDERKCLGCRYCVWNCPYDAPKYNSGKRIIEKCNLCADSGEDPACATACPTGALSFEELSGGNEQAPPWFPRGKLEPAFEFSGNTERSALKIVPGERFLSPEYPQLNKTIIHEWSLILFSFMAMISVSVITSSLIKGVLPGGYFIPMILFTAFISLFHLGKPARAWRALSNPRSSPLSREIYTFLIYSSVATLALLLESTGLLLAASLTGLIFLITIDSVYFSPDRKALYYSGQTFLSALLLISYFTGSILPLTFIIVVKLVLSLLRFEKKDHLALRFLKSAIPVLVCAGLLAGVIERNILLSVLIISSELADRFLFYTDYEPENLKLLIVKHINVRQYEKKRG